MTFLEQNDAYVEQRHHGYADTDPDAYDAWCEDMQEQQDQERTRQRVKAPPKKMRQYK